jgi:hypothetical protein
VSNRNVEKVIQNMQVMDIKEVAAEEKIKEKTFA